MNFNGLTGAVAVESSGNTTSPTTGNKYFLNSNYCSVTTSNSIYQVGGQGGSWHINGVNDGVQQTPGANYEVSVSGQTNKIDLNMVQPTTTPILRGVIFQATASVGNSISSFTSNNVVSYLVDNGQKDTYQYQSGVTFNISNLQVLSMMGIGAVAPSTAFPSWTQLSNSNNSWIGIKNTGAGGAGVWIDGGSGSQGTIQFLVNGISYGSIVGSAYNLLFYGATGNLDALLESDDNFHFTNSIYAVGSSFSSGVTAASYSIAPSATATPLSIIAVKVNNLSPTPTQITVYVVGHQ